MRTLILPLLLLASFGAHPSLAKNTWMPDLPEIPLDPRITADQLPNGLRFVHAQHQDANDSVSLRLIINTGSNDEDESELGYAHFVEHMAFNGTTHFPGETLGATLAEAGIRFGPEVNAFTSPDQTVYQLDLSHRDPATVELALRVMRDWCDGLTFDADQVKRERKVVLAEIAARGVISGPFFQERMGFVYPDHPLGDRFMAGTPRSVDTAKVDGLRAFYQRWYRPDNAILTVVGNFPPEQITARIKTHFESFQARGPAPARRPRPLAANPDKPRLHWTQIGPIKSFNFNIVHTRPEPAVDSVERRRHFLTTQVVLNVIQSRLNRKVLLAPSEVEQISIAMANPALDVAELTFGISGRPQHWQELLRELIHEHRRLLQYGILPEELEETREFMLKRIAYARRQPQAERASEYSQRLIDALAHGRVMSAKESAFAFAESVLPTLTVEDCRTAVADFLETGRPRFFIFGDLREAGKSQDLVASLQSSMSDKLSAPALPAREPFPYDDFGPVGTIASQTHDPVSDVHQVQFTNGVRLNFKQTEFAAESVSTLVRLHSGGLLKTPPDMTALPTVAGRSLIAGGLGAMNVEALTRSLNGRFAELNFNVDEDSLVFSGKSDREQVEVLCRMIGAYLTDPAFNEAAVTHAVAETADEARYNSIVPEITLRANFLHVISDKDDRFRPTRPKAISAIQAADVRAWLEPQLQSSPIEISMVGDILLEDAIAVVAQTLGALPARGPASAWEPVAWRIKEDNEKISSLSPDGRAGLVLLWPVKLKAGVRSHRELELLTKGLELLVLEGVREEKGLAYSPKVSVWYPDSEPSLAYIRADVISTQRDTERADREIRKIARNLAAEGFDKVLLVQALNPTLDELDEQLSDNAYWLHAVLDRLSTHPEQLRYAASREQDLRAISTARLSELAAEIFRRNTEIQIFAGFGDRR